MARATKAHKARRLNAAYHLLDRQVDVAEAARQLQDRFALSRRQAYRYLAQAAALSAPVAAVEPTVAITFKLPLSVVRALRTAARRRGFTLGDVVTQALSSFLGALHRRRG